MNADAKEAAFQQDIIDQMIAGGWKLGNPAKYDRKLALYTEDCLQYVKTTQPKTWEKYKTLYPSDPEQAFIDKLASQLSKADPQASDKSLRTFGTLGVLRHELRDKSASFKMCQFKPEHGLNPDTLAMYEGNILRVVPELVYSPWTAPDSDSDKNVSGRALAGGDNSDGLYSWRLAPCRSQGIVSTPNAGGSTWYCSSMVSPS